MKNVLMFLVAVILGTVTMIFILNPFSKQSKPLAQTTLNNSPTTYPTSKFSIENAPSESLKGQILSMSGSVKWQSRSATESSTLASPIPIQQAEKIITEDTGRAKVEFLDVGVITFSPNTSLEFIQTLPSNLVLNQSSGTLQIIKQGNTPISIRSLHLLTKLNDGNFILSIDDSASEITLNVLKGSAQVAYNDSEFITQVANINENELLLFDEETRKIKIQSN